MIKNLFKILTTIAFLFIATPVLAADIDITCNTGSEPTITTSSTPLFNISNFLPGDSITKEIYIKNTDTNPCVIYMKGRGTTGLLSDKINVLITDTWGVTEIKTLSDFMTTSTIEIANLNENEELTKYLSLTLDESTNNTYKSQTTGFDIVITSEWGNEAQVERYEEEVLGTETTLVQQVQELLGIGSGDEPPGDEKATSKEQINNEETKGIADTENSCSKTLWWLVPIAQLLFTFVILALRFRNQYKFLYQSILAILLGIGAYFLIKLIGLGCCEGFFCTNYWILNLLIALLVPIANVIEKGRKL